MPESDSADPSAGTTSGGLLDRLPPQLRRYLPPIFFFGGFAWDAITLGRQIKPSDLLILLGYLTGAAVILVVLGREPGFRRAEYLNTALQFFFGGILSALFIFYFLSSSGLAGILFVLVLGGLLVGNEFLESAYSELTLSWAFFALCAIMFFNFALAHLFRSISTFWFYLGTLVASLLVIALWRTSKRKSSILPAVGVAAVMIALHAMNVIPPVPLVKKQMLIAHEVEKSDGGYVATIEPPGFERWRASSKTFHREAGDRAYCFTSVFVPRGIETTIRHRWQHYDPERGWLEAGTVPFRIAGGRQTGYRGYTFKSNVTVGRWRVIAEAESGAAIGIVEFDVKGEGTARTRRIRL